MSELHKKFEEMSREELEAVLAAEHAKLEK